MVDTKRVSDRRELWFDTIDECIAEIDRIVAADQQGTLRTLGNWTPGQIMGHVAAWIEFSWDGYPIKAPPFFVRWVLRLMFKRMLKKGMSPGAKIPGVEGGTLGMDPMETGAAAERLKAAFARLAAGEPAKFDSPAFGPMTDPQRVGINLRHAAMHFGFLRYD